MKLPFGYELIINEPKQFLVRKNIHPDYKKSIEFVLTLEGEDYYTFTTIADTPAERYYQCSQFMAEMDLRMNREQLEAYLEKAGQMINEGNFGKVAAIVEEMRIRSRLLIETDTMYKLASCVFFTLEEDLTTYDYDYNDKKIAKFKRENVGSFFLKEPVKRFLPLPNISAEDLLLCLKLTEARNRMSEYLMK